MNENNIQDIAMERKSAVIARQLSYIAPQNDLHLWGKNSNNRTQDNAKQMQSKLQNKSRRTPIQILGFR